jgi:hypothetical protein
MLTATTSLAMLAAYCLASRGTMLLAVAAGGAAALAFTSKYPGLSLIVPVAWAVIERAWRADSLVSVINLSLGALGGFLLTVMVSCPPCVLHSDRMLGAMQLYQGLNWTPGVFPNNDLVPTLGWYGKPYLYEVVASLPYGLGWPLYGLALIGLVLAIRRFELADRIVLATIVPYFAVMGRSQVVFPKYFMPMYPGLVLLAVGALVSVRRRRVVGLVAAGVWLYSLVLTASQVARFSPTPQQEVASWIAAATVREGRGPVRVGVPYLMLGLDYYRVAGWVQRVGLTYVPVADGHWLDSQPDALVLPEWLEIAIRRDRPDSESAHELDRLQSGMAGYREAKRWRSWYLQRDFYTWLDPAFAGDLWQNAIGFVVYLREPGRT